MSSESNTDGLRKLNKDLLARNAELIKKLNRMKTERDNFEQLFIDWKKINKDASEALNLLQNDKQKCEKENKLLHDQIKEYKLQINSLKLQNNERSEQCNHLLLRCNQYQKDINGININNNNNNINALKFNYQQKKNEIDQILYQIQKLFHFCHANYPKITSTLNANFYHHNNLNDITEEYNNENNDETDFKSQERKKKKIRDFKKKKTIKNMKHKKHKKHKKPKKHRTTKSLSDFDKQIFRKRRSLNYIYDIQQNEQNKEIKEIGKQKEKKQKKQRIVINKVKMDNNNNNNNNNNNSNIDCKITPELLGPKTSYDPFTVTDPFNNRTQSYHSFFNDQTQQKQQTYHYNKVQLNMNKGYNKQLWNKRDSLSRKKKKQPRINAIPSSAGATPLTTPQQSYRNTTNKSVQYDDDDDIMFVNEDPHQKYLEMMNNKPTTATTDVTAVTSNRDNLTDKKTIHDLFDMLQQQTLSQTVPNATNSCDQQTERDNKDSQLVPLPEPFDSSSHSETDSDSSSED